MMYRLRSLIKYSVFNFQTKGILSTPPLKTSDAPRYSLHSLVCKRDLQPYLLSVKSFISRVPGAYVIVHSDGSIDSKTRNILATHIPGIQIVSREDAEKRAKEEVDKYLQEIRNYGGCFDRLIDSILWSKSKKHIQMDSDILTVRDPVYIEDWINNGAKPFVISDFIIKDIRNFETYTLQQNDHIQTQLEKNQKQISGKLGLKFTDTGGLCAGLYGWNDELKLEDICRFVKICEELHFDMRKWGAEQVVTTWLLNARNAERLPIEKYINLQKAAFHLRKSASMIHFIGNNRFRNGWYASMAVSEIKRLMNIKRT